jgi:hypothetical protein
MGAIADAINAAFRDFNTNGVSASGVHSVVKADVRAIGGIIETGLGPPQNYTWNALGAAVATLAALPANTYANGTAGVGAALTGNSNGALAAVDGVTPTLNMRILVQNEAAPANNGLYQVTQVGDGSHPYILTRTADANTPALLALMGIAITGGAVNAGRQFVLQIAAANITIGTTALTFALYLASTGYAPGLSPYTSDNATDGAIVFDSAKMLAEEIRGDNYENNLALGPRTLPAWSAQLAGQPIGALARIGAVKTNAILSQLSAYATLAVPKAGSPTTISSTGQATQICIGVGGETAFAIWTENVSGTSKVYYSTWALHGGTPSAGAILIDLSALSLSVFAGTVKVDVDGKTIHIIVTVVGSNTQVFHYSSTNMLASLSQPHFIDGGSGANGVLQAGRIEQLDDGTLLVAGYTFNGTFNSRLYASLDQGVSWALRSTIATGTAYTNGNARDETSLLRNRTTKELVAQIRSDAETGGAAPVYTCRSEDDGNTWSSGVASSWNGRGMPWIEDIGGGALVYFDRSDTPVLNNDVIGRISLDFGRTWGSQFILDNASGNNGYLSMVPTGGRTFLVAYQINGNVVFRALTFDPAINTTWSPAPSVTGGTLGTVAGAKYRRSGDLVECAFTMVVTMSGAGAASASFTLPETSSDLGAANPVGSGGAIDATGVYPGYVYLSGTTGEIKFPSLPNGASTVTVNLRYML